MASITPRRRRNGQLHYRAEIRLRGYPPQCATFELKTDAKRWATQTEAAIRDGRYFRTLEASKHTLAELIERYWRDVLPGKGPWQEFPARVLLESMIEAVPALALRARLRQALRLFAEGKSSVGCA